MAVEQPGTTGHDQEQLREQSIGDLLKQLSQETTTLVRKELELAKAEVTEKGKQAMDVYFQRIQSIIDMPDLPSRLRFMLMVCPPLYLAL